MPVNMHCHVWLVRFQAKNGSLVLLSFLASGILVQFRH